MTKEENQVRRVGLVSFQASHDLISAIDEAAAKEGVSRSDIARRALMRDLQRAASEVA
jgi:metal-responsive CopG/Arc/MetJ family transcriptional regulator